MHNRPTLRHCLIGLLCLPLVGLLSGCGPKTTEVADTSKLTVEQKIKSIQSSDLPAPMKEKAIADLQAKQTNGETAK